VAGEEEVLLLLLLLFDEWVCGREGEGLLCRASFPSSLWRCQVGERPVCLSVFASYLKINKRDVRLF